MKVNKALMDKARFERKLISELTVKEFRVLMQECLTANKEQEQKIAREKEMYERNPAYCMHQQAEQIRQLPSIWVTEK